MSCPSAAFVDGVQIGSSSFSACWYSFSNLCPRNGSPFLYASYIEPNMYPRTITSYGIILSFFTRIVRPSYSGFWNSLGMSLRSEEIMWFFTMSPVIENQKFESAFKTFPLSVIIVGRITSNAEMRSVVTITILPSSRSYTSRTFPLIIFFMVLPLNKK